VIEEFNRAQISINLTNYRVSPPHEVFDAICRLAGERGMRVTGSELVGLIPREAILAAGRHYLERQGKTSGVPEAQIVEAAVLSLGLNDVKEFVPEERIIEYSIAERPPLASLTVAGFADETSSDSPAPGGGSVAALCGALASALAAMVAALTHGKKGHEESREEMDRLAQDAQIHKDAFLAAIDDDTQAFNRVMDAMRLPKNTDENQAARAAAMEAANRVATEIPLGVLRRGVEILPLVRAAAERANPNSISDAGVAAAAARAAADGAYLNVRINLGGIEDATFKESTRKEADRLVAEARSETDAIRQHVEKHLE
jgi:glutamate formiminotransferase/formiminotetrahydrofolate cyclodeaminase